MPQKLNMLVEGIELRQNRNRELKRRGQMKLLQPVRINPKGVQMTCLKLDLSMSKLKVTQAL